MLFTDQFMSASGLSGGRETIDVAREHTLTVANGGDTEEALRRVDSQTAVLRSLHWAKVRLLFMA